MDSEYFELWEEEFEKREDKTLKPRGRIYSSDEAPRWRKNRKGFKDHRRKFKLEKF